MAQNNAALLGQISKLVADFAENIKRSSVEAADEQLRTFAPTELKNDCACVTCDPVGGKISTQATNC